MSSAADPSGGEWGRPEGKALEVLAACIGDVVGERSEAYRNLVRALASNNPLDMHLARDCFDALAPELRREIWARVQAIGRARRSAAPHGGA